MTGFKGDGGPTVWIGTNSGKVVSFAINVPNTNQRQSSPLICSTTGNRSGTKSLFMAYSFCFSWSLRSPLVAILFVENDQFITACHTGGKPNQQPQFDKVRLL